MAEKELEIYLELGVLPKAGISWKRRWGDRTTELVNDIAEMTGTSVEELDELAGSNEEFGDLLVEAADRAGRVADPDYRHALARLVGAACDQARIDEMAYLTALVVKLEPVDLRALLYGWSFSADGQIVEPAQAQVAQRHSFKMQELMYHLQTSPMVSQMIVETLYLASLLSLDSLPDGDRWQPTLVAAGLLVTVFPDVREIATATPRPAPESAEEP